jgi:polar amino acid transport system substrate-binding protein
LIIRGFGPLDSKPPVANSAAPIHLRRLASRITTAQSDTLLQGGFRSMRCSHSKPWRGGWRSAPAILLLSIAGLSLVVSAQTTQLRLVSTAWPPFTNDPGQPRFALDLVEAALGRIGVTTQTTIVDAARFTPSLLSGPFDGSAAAWKDPERERVLLYSQPYLENRLILVARRGGDVSAKALTDLKGRRIALVEGYSYGDAVEAAGATFVRSSSEEDSLRLLLDGKVDYTLMDELVVQYIVTNHAKEAQSRLQVGSSPLVTRPLYFAVRRTLADAEGVINRFNAQLRGMIADRTYHRLLHVDWIRADIDGDGLLENVPRSDLAGPLEPKAAYSLLTIQQPATTLQSPQQRFYFGGETYPSWTAVPERYKARDPSKPDSSRSTVPIFRFTW